MYTEHSAGSKRDDGLNEEQNRYEQNRNIAFYNSLAVTLGKNKQCPRQIAYTKLLNTFIYYLPCL